MTQLFHSMSPFCFLCLIRTGRFSAADSAVLVGFKKLRDESFRKPVFTQAGFTLRFENADGSVYAKTGTTIGHKRILTFPKQLARTIRLTIDQAKGERLIAEFNAFMIDERLILK